MFSNANLVEQAKVVTGLAPAAPGATPDYVSLKGYLRMTALLSIKNATTVTGSAITLKQASSVAAAGEKPLPFTRAYRNLDAGLSDALTEFAVTGDTFTTDATNSKDLMYAIEITPDMLDVANGFDCVRVGAAAGTALTVTIIYILWPAKHGGRPPSAIID